MVDRIHARSDDRAFSMQGTTQIRSPHALASWALYADRGPDKGTTEYEQHQHTQARFASTQTSDLVKVEEIESDNITLLSYNRTEGEEAGNIPAPSTNNRAEHCQKANNWEQYAFQMVMSCGRVKYKRPQLARTSGPPSQTQAVGGGFGGDPLVSSSEDDKGEPPLPPEGLQITWPLNDLNIGPKHNPLDQDYAQHSMSVQQVQHAIAQGHQGTLLYQPALAQGQNTANIRPQMQLVAPLGIPAPLQGQTGMDHEVHMIENLRHHIWDSLVGIPDNLPELKGLRAKMPEAYESKDNFDCLDNWLQGLL
jgi:hypothetical protein